MGFVSLESLYNEGGVKRNGPSTATTFSTLPPKIITAMSTVSFQLKVICYRDRMDRTDWVLMLADEEHRLLWSVLRDRVHYIEPPRRAATAAMPYHGRRIAQNLWSLKRRKYEAVAYETEVGWVPAVKTSALRKVVKETEIPRDVRNWTGLDWVVNILERLALDGQQVTALGKEELLERVPPKRTTSQSKKRRWTSFDWVVGIVTKRADEEEDDKQPPSRAEVRRPGNPRRSTAT
ncbi:hypothetical protein NMY22_g3309 [Coprinellus aureogranulatus]|nr:hypothetical protein NMY22_g3309 [Coprinellus aureogranulatus]